MLANNRGVLVVGDARTTSTSDVPAAIELARLCSDVLTNYYTDQSGHHLMGYIGLDSNVPKREVAWHYQGLKGRPRGLRNAWAFLYL